MALYHLVNTLTNDAGDKLVGYYVRLRSLATGNIAPIYANSDSDPIVDVSGVVNAAKTDDTGLYSLYVADGNYDIQFYDKNDINNLLRIIPDVPMFGFNTETLANIETASDLADAAAASATAAGDSATAAAASATAADASATDASDQLALVEAEGTAQIALVGAEGTAQIALVEAEGTAQIALVEAEGTAQIALVGAAGDAEVAAVTASLASGQSTIARMITGVAASDAIVFDEEPAEGEYLLTHALPYDASIFRLVAENLTPSGGSFRVTVLVDGVAVAGPYTVTTSGIDVTPAILADADARVTLLLDNITGAVENFFLYIYYTSTEPGVIPGMSGPIIDSDFTMAGGGFLLGRSASGSGAIEEIPVSSLGGGAWQEIETIATTSGTEAIFDNIPDIYADIDFEINGVSHDGTGSGSQHLQVQISTNNGSSWSAASAATFSTVAAASAAYGAVRFDRYATGTGKVMQASVAVLTTDPSIATGASGMGKPVVAGAPVNAVRFTWNAGGVFDLGSIVLRGK